jgi:UDP-N-acetylmuramate dehydrogenase
MDGAVGERVAEGLKALFGERVRFQEPLSRHTSFRIGGPADAWVEVSAPQEIVAAHRLAASEGVPVTILGGGTNVLVSDRGVRGLVFRLGREFTSVQWFPGEETTRVHAGAAGSFKKLCLEAAARGLTGLEFAEGIPGSIGGGLLMNAGAFGGEIADVLEAVVGVNPERGAEVLPRSALKFGYRFFDLPKGFTVTEVHFVLRRGDVDAIRARMADVKQRRESKQPLGMPNAGSIFKNPPGEFAGRLIESLGLKGRRVGGAMISERHANFIVNTGRATAAEVKQLMDEIAEAVWKERAVRLQAEIKLLGDWENR